MTAAEQKEFIMGRIDYACRMAEFYLARGIDENEASRQNYMSFNGILMELQRIADAFGFGGEAERFLHQRQHFYRARR